MTEDQRVLHREGAMLKLRQNLEQQISRDEEAVLQRFHNEFAALERMTRKANIDFIRKVDNALMRTLGMGLSFWIPKQPIRQLRAGERRYVALVPASTPHGPVRRRSCIDHGDGIRSYEMPEVMSATRASSTIPF